MSGRESLINTLDQAWVQGRFVGPILRTDIIAFTNECTDRLFATRESELIVADDSNGLTVAGRVESEFESDTRTIFAAQLAPEKDTLSIELHDSRMQSHFRPGDRLPGIKDCRLFELDLACGGIRLFVPDRERGKKGDRHLEELSVTARQHYASLYRALSAKALLKLIGADPTDDILNSPFAMGKLMESHCAADPLVQHPADAFLKPSIQESIRVHLGEA